MCSPFLFKGASACLLSTQWAEESSRPAWLQALRFAAIFYHSRSALLSFFSLKWIIFCMKRDKRKGTISQWFFLNLLSWLNWPVFYSEMYLFYCLSTSEVTFNKSQADLYSGSVMTEWCIGATGCWEVCTWKNNGVYKFWTLEFFLHF